MQLTPRVENMQKTIFSIKSRNEIYFFFEESLIYQMKKIHMSKIAAEFNKIWILERICSVEIFSGSQRIPIIDPFFISLQISFSTVYRFKYM